MDLPLFNLPTHRPSHHEANAARDHAVAQVAAHAEEHRPSFAEEAASFVVAYLEAHGATAGEVITIACKEAGIRPHDDRAFGAVYLRLSRRGVIAKVGVCRRRRGHNTAGGNVWDVVQQQEASMENAGHEGAVESGNQEPTPVNEPPTSAPQGDGDEGNAQQEAAATE